MGMASIFEPLTAQKRTAVKKQIKDTPEVEALRDKLRGVADAVCVYDNLCPDVYTYLHDPKYGLGLGPMPRETQHQVEFTIIIDGAERQTKSFQYAYTAGAARLRYLASMGVKNAYETPPPPPADGEAVVEDSAEVAAYKQMIVAAVQDGISNGRIKRALVNRYFPHLGIPKLPGKQRFTFLVPVAMPTEAVYISYTGDGMTEEEALANATANFRTDEQRIADKRDRYYGGFAAGSDPRLLPAVEGATLTLSEATPPRDLE